MNKGVSTVIVLVLLAGAVFLIVKKWQQLHPEIEPLPPPMAMPGQMAPNQ